jgi:hypothetical protein
MRWVKNEKRLGHLGNINVAHNKKDTTWQDKDFVHMGVSAPFTFGFLKISDSHISLLSRIMTLNM